MKEVIWISDLGDRVYNKVVWWMQNYDKGKVCATRKFMTKPGERGPGVEVIDMPTAKAVEIPWKLEELTYFTELLEYKLPKYPVTWGFRSDLPNWKNGKLLAGGARVITMAIYPEALEAIFKAISEVKHGKGKETKTDLTKVDIESVL